MSCRLVLPWLWQLVTACCFLTVCREDLLHSELWPLHYTLARQHPPVQLGAWHLHQHSTVRARQLAAPGPGPVSHGELVEVNEFSVLGTISCRLLSGCNYNHRSLGGDESSVPQSHSSVPFSLWKCFWKSVLVSAGVFPAN